MLAATQIIVVWLVAAFYECVGGVATGTAAVSSLAGPTGEDADLDYYYKRVYDFGLGKRAYTYSANKRPQYDFGIGKRVPDSRNNGQKLYAFGLGKRDTFDADSFELSDNDASSFTRADLEKRIKPYDFGLGKRAAPAPYNFGLGKRQPGPGPHGKLYSFGLGKRYGNDYGISQRSQRYNFGIGKRDVNDIDNDNLDRFFLSLEQEQEEEDDNEAGRPHNIATRASQKYNFGLGKRDRDTLAYYYDQLASDNAKRASRYNFGLGKRSAQAFARTLAAYDDQLLDQLEHHNLYPRASQKFNFGLGKREVSKEDLDQLEAEAGPSGTVAKAASAVDLVNSEENEVAPASTLLDRSGDYSRSHHVPRPALADIALKQQ